MASRKEGSSTDDSAPKGVRRLFRHFSIRQLRTDSGSVESPSESGLENDTGNWSDGSGDSHESPETRRRRKKNWAHSYINGPLNAPEPSQVTGLNASLVCRPEIYKNSEATSYYRNAAYRHSQSSPDPVPVPPTLEGHRRSSTSDRSTASNATKSSKQFTQQKQDEQKLVEIFGFDPSCPSRDIHLHHTKTAPPLSQRPTPSPPVRDSLPHYNSAESFRQRRNSPFQTSPIPKKSSYPPITTSQGSSSVHRSQSVFTNRSTLEQHKPLVNKRSATMSQRPLDQIKRDVKAANRSSHLRKKNLPGPDVIDNLDTVSFGGAYHHDGPFDATLAARNQDKRYAPVEAVRESNMEALRATPYEYVQDSLQKHVPLQGTATVPPGSRDMFGRRMSYEEGADVMREADAPGGAYRRYEHVPYRPEDLKGKGEPSYTIERDAKEQKKFRKQTGTEDSGSIYEMQPTRRSPNSKDRGVYVRQRSTSAAAGPSDHRTPRGASNDIDVRRSSTTGKRLSEGLKKRFGSLKRRVQDEF